MTMNSSQIPNPTPNIVPNLRTNHAIGITLHTHDRNIQGGSIFHKRDALWGVLF